jgi:hypothetical protein
MQNDDSPKARPTRSSASLDPRIKGYLIGWVVAIVIAVTLCGTLWLIGRSITPNLGGP